MTLSKTDARELFNVLRDAIHVGVLRALRDAGLAQGRPPDGPGDAPGAPGHDGSRPRDLGSGGIDPSWLAAQEKLPTPDR